MFIPWLWSEGDAGGTARRGQEDGRQDSSETTAGVGGAELMLVCWNFRHWICDSGALVRLGQDASPTEVAKGKPDVLEEA